LSDENVSPNEKLVLCEVCGFDLWKPIARLAVSTLGLYSDERFPGRCILALNEHHERWEHLDSELLHRLVDDSQIALRAIEAATGSARVNLAVLGNTDPHVHFHLIPRFPAVEPNPTKSPWDDPRPRRVLPAAREQELQQLIREAIS